MENAKTLEENLNVIKQHLPDNWPEIKLPNDRSRNVRILESKTGRPVFRVLGEADKWLTLHSLVDPAKEAADFCNGAVEENDSIIVILGAGAGYHVEQIIRRSPRRIVVVVEKEPLILKELLSRVNLEDWYRNTTLYFICSSDISEIIQALSQIQITHRYLPVTILEHPPSVKAFYGFYSSLMLRLSKIKKLNLTSRLRYPKFKKDALKVLILQSKYYLLAELIQSLRKNGHTTRAVMVPTGKEAEGTHDIFEKIIQEVICFKPDFVLTINHLGFDREGILTDFFTSIELPYASWYVDSPVFILEDFKKQVSPFLTIFLWDRDYLGDLKSRGFENLFFLPLATETDIFKPVPNHKNPYLYLKNRVGFVGCSGSGIIEECLNRIPGNGFAKQLLDKISNSFVASTDRFIGSMNLEHILNEQELKLYGSIMDKNALEFEPAVTWRSTQMYRLSCVQKLGPFNPSIHGDEGWQHFLDSRFVVRPELNYYDELPFFYNLCTINFNTTSLQMRNGLNQRVFDVPACGSFLLTDYKSQLEEVFDVGREVICYQCPDEIEALAAHYLRNEKTRNEVIMRARRRIAAEHTYSHRLNKMTDTMKKIYG